MYQDVTCDHGLFSVTYSIGDGDLCVDECPVCVRDREDKKMNTIKKGEQ